LASHDTDGVPLGQAEADLELFDIEPPSLSATAASVSETPPEIEALFADVKPDRIEPAVAPLTAETADRPAPPTSASIAARAEALAAAASARIAELPPLVPPQETEVLASAWESAVVRPVDLPSDNVPSMWVPHVTGRGKLPARDDSPAAADAETPHPEPADFLLEPMTMSAPAPDLSPEAALETDDEIQDLFAVQSNGSAAGQSLAPLPEPAIAPAGQPANVAPVVAALQEESSSPAMAVAQAPSPPAASRPAPRSMPRPPPNDPLAPLKAMSDEERIALFT
jgi:hypothetical protein